MPAIPASVPSSLRARARVRTAVVASADRSFRQRLTSILGGLRWQVREVEGAAGVWTEAERAPLEAVIVDSWLPDLELSEFLRDFKVSFPHVDLVTAAGAPEQEGPRGPHRRELLYALGRCQDSDTAAWNSAPALAEAAPTQDAAPRYDAAAMHNVAAMQEDGLAGAPRICARPLRPAPVPGCGFADGADPESTERLPELIGNALCMIEVSRRIRLVAPRLTPVLIEGPTGSGKEIVARALHRLSSRNRKPMIAINCAAIPEALLEAELFGHTRGAFTGAVKGRVGRIEAADGGTLFLDEIGEMPLALQSKLLRFVECGELQRVGENETVKVDVRILAATHRPLAQQAAEGSFRSDLYYRLAVFLIRTPALAEHSQDLPLLVEHFLQQLGRELPVKRADAGTMAKLSSHSWPGNVRELEHVLERAVILAGDAPVLTERDIDFGVSVN